MPDEPPFSMDMMSGEYIHQNMQDCTREHDSSCLDLLRNCGRNKDLLTASMLHADILRAGLLERSPYITSALITVYVKCGTLVMAQHVFEELPVRYVACWNALISGFLKEGQCHQALNYFVRMKRESFLPDRVTFTCALKACGSTRAIDTGRQIHNEIVNTGMLMTNIMLGNALVDMYTKSYMLLEALHVLEELPTRNIITWSTLIVGYAQNGQSHKALDCYYRMQNEGLPPDEITFSCILKVCGRIRDLNMGKKIHDEIVRSGLLRNDIVLGTALVDMYAKCGELAKAQQVLEALPSRNAVTWSAIIAGYVEKLQFHEALTCFETMQRENINPTEVTFTCILKACGSTGSINMGRKIHNEIINKDLLMESVVLGAALVDMYASCGDVAKAEQVFTELPFRDIVSWSSLIAGYVKEGQGHEALSCFERMQMEGLLPNEVTYVCVLKACGIIGSVDRGQKVHEDILQRDLLTKSIVLGNALVDMYAKCGMLAKAWQLLEELPIRNVVTWNALVAGFVQHEQGHDALNAFTQMQKEGHLPDEVTFTCILKACGSIGTIDIGKQIHEDIVQRGLLEKNIMIGTALMDMYAKCGMPTNAKEVLQNLSFRDTASWNVVISGYVQEGINQEALDCFASMRREGFSPNEVTFTCVLNACRSIAAIEKGKQIHNEIVNGGFLGKNIILGNALIDMYAKCGMPTKAEKVLRELPVRDTVSWSALIAGYAQEGHYHEAVICFKKMQTEGIAPNEVTFVSLLNAFTHSGKLDEAQMYYENMRSKYGIIPDLEHHVCMVVVFGCAGCFDKATEVIQAMPSPRDPSIWLALLGTCMKWGNVKLGKAAFDQAIQQDDNLAAAYVLMANIYSTAGMQYDAEKVEAMRVSNAILKHATTDRKCPKK